VRIGVLGLARPDRSGRVTERGLLHALHWGPDHRIDIRLPTGMLIIASAPEGQHVVGSSCVIRSRWRWTRAWALNIRILQCIDATRRRAQHRSTGRTRYRARVGRRHRPGLAAALVATVSAVAGCVTPHPSDRGPVSSPSPTAAERSGCAAGQFAVTWLPGQSTTAAVCVHVGTEVVVALHTGGGYRWGQPTSSAPAVATVNEAGYDQDGGTHVTVSAVAAGTTVIGSSAGPTRSWQLTVTVVP
jgi:hypothetical protein